MALIKVRHHITGLLNHRGIQSLWILASILSPYLRLLLVYHSHQSDKTYQTIQEHVGIPPHQLAPLPRRLRLPRTRDRMQNLFPQRPYQTRLLLLWGIHSESSGKAPHFRIALLHLEGLRLRVALHEVRAGAECVALGDGGREEVGEVREESGEEVGVCLVPADISVALAWSVQMLRRLRIICYLKVDIPLIQLLRIHRRHTIRCRCSN